MKKLGRIQREWMLHRVLPREKILRPLCQGPEVHPSPDTIYVAYSKIFPKHMWGSLTAHPQNSKMYV